MPLIASQRSRIVPRCLLWARWPALFRWDSGVRHMASHIALIPLLFLRMPFDWGKEGLKWEKLFTFLIAHFCFCACCPGLQCEISWKCLPEKQWTNCQCLWFFVVASMLFFKKNIYYCMLSLIEFKDIQLILWLPDTVKCRVYFYFLVKSTKQQNQVIKFSFLLDVRGN